MKYFAVRWGKLTYTVILGVYFIYCAWTPTTWHYIDGANLLIHEAGHVIFSLFGDYITVLGATVLQVAIPAIFALYFWWRIQFVDACIMLLWLGESLVNVSVYAADAVTRQLPLISGDVADHDWHYLLAHINRLDQTVPIANAIFGLGVTFLIVGALGALYFSLFNRDAPGKTE